MIIIYLKRIITNKFFMIIYDVIFISILHGLISCGTLFYLIQSTFHKYFHFHLYFPTSQVQL